MEVQQPDAGTWEAVTTDNTHTHTHQDQNQNQNQISISESHVVMVVSKM